MSRSFSSIGRSLSVSGRSVVQDDLPDSGLEHRWPTEDGSASTLGDSEGSADGSISGATWVSGDGKGGYHLDYDGDNDETVVSYENLVSTTSEITLGYWVNFDTLSEDQRILLRSNAYTLWYDNKIGALRFELNDGSTWFGDAGIPKSNLSLDTWLNVVGTYDGSNAKIYLDGNEQDSVSASNSINDPANDLYFGSLGNGVWLDGGLDDPVFYSRGLSASDVQALYDATKGNYS